MCTRGLYIMGVWNFGMVEIVFKRRQVIFDPLMSSRYHEYLASSEWKALRAEKIKSVDGCCEHCGSYIGNRGHCHHNTYERLFREELDDLTYVCPDEHPR